MFGYEPKGRRFKSGRGYVLTLSEIQDYLKRFSYKQGWTIKAWEGAYEGWHIGIRTELPDAYNPGDTVTIDVNALLPPMQDLAALKTWLFWRIKQIEIHECMEFFKFDDEIVFDPHREFSDRDEVVLV